jgi:hypothetical protein
MSYFLETALRSTSGYNIENLDDKFSVDDIPQDFQDKADAIVDVFIEKATRLGLFTDFELMDSSNIEHDLWLTMHGHGAGFWDGDYEHGDALTKLAKTFPKLEDKLRDLLGE